MLDRTTSSARRAVAFLWLAFSVALSGCFPIPVEVPSRPNVLDARDLLGEWYVAATNFPMWLDGEKTDPRFRYTDLREKDGIVTFDDEVSYLPKGERERETILGTDTQDPSIPAHFTWRGDGALILFTSEWYVAHVGEGGTFAIIFFTETPATPAGVDVITRTPYPSAKVFEEAEEILKNDPFLRSQSQGLVWLRGAR